MQQLNLKGSESYEHSRKLLKAESDCGLSIEGYRFVVHLLLAHHLSAIFSEANLSHAAHANRPSRLRRFTYSVNSTKDSDSTADLTCDSPGAEHRA